MGISWRFAMPMLSTLAALVILVHSAEEEVDRDYRYDLNPRNLEPDTPDYGQLWRDWRTQDAEPMMQQSTQKSTWQDSPEEPLRRRRPVRKRKRRPPPSTAEDSTRENRHYSEEQPAHQEPYYNVDQTTESPRRRRKKTDRRNRWTEEYLETERPSRTRGQRRKRPSLDSWPELSEFNYYQPADNPTHAEMRTFPDKLPNAPYNNQNSQYVESDFDNASEAKELKQILDTTAEFTDPFQAASAPDGNIKNVNETEVQDDRLKDKSFSEYSMEQLAPYQPKNRESKLMVEIEKHDKAKNKGKYDRVKEKDTELIFYKYFSRDYNTKAFRVTKENGNIDNKLPWLPMFDFFAVKLSNDADKSLEKLKRSYQTEQRESAIRDKELLSGGDSPIDPITLKDILKRSNGTSLSEILQQHNLSLADLLHGRESAISVLQSDDIVDSQRETTAFREAQETLESKYKPKIKDETETKEDKIKENKFVTEFINGNATDKDPHSNNQTETRTTESIAQVTNTQANLTDNAPKLVPKRRFPGGIRRRLRMRPTVNSTFKGQLNRDLMALTARKYFHHNRNVSKLKEWKLVIPSMVNISNANNDTKNKDTKDAPITTTSTPEEITTQLNTEYSNPSTISIDIQTSTKQSQKENSNTETFITTETVVAEVATEEQKSLRTTRPGANRIGLRRQAFNNRLKRKRLKQRNSTTEPPNEQDDLKDFFGMPNLVSSSEFIARTQAPKSTVEQDSEEDFTTPDDFITTETSRTTDNGARRTRILPNLSTTMAPKVATTLSTTEETAQVEIEEILNDTRTSARLSRILMERNMTLNELVEHRERGSSHVHLADIFHNASKEPNPPEPFLSKSLIEPISKETYPLRAILEANHHDPTAKVTTIDPNTLQTQLLNIPIFMDFGNNVNENGENMGIMSLFNKFTGKDISIEKSTLMKDSEGTPYITTVISVNTTNTSDTDRESRVLRNKLDVQKQDIVGWNELFELMRKNNNTETTVEQSSTKGSSESHKKPTLEEDTDGDGVIVLEDLQHFKDFDSNIASASDEKFEVNTYNSATVPLLQPGILNKIPSNTRSVTVATASIVGLAMILFLLTYAIFKWKQQRRLLRKKQSNCGERIPTPVFENRKGHKNNCSIRSISPMLASSNIYTMNTLESQNGKESPEYMWDTLRKPFQ